MATFKINGKNFATQDGTGAATIHSDVVFPAGTVLQVAQSQDHQAFSYTNTTTWDFGNTTTRANDSHGGFPVTIHSPISIHPPSISRCITTSIL